MHTPSSRRARGAFLVALALLAPAAARAQQQRPRLPQDTLKSPVVGENGSVTFQLFAPKATEVTIRSEGPAPFANAKMARNEQGVWSLTTPVAPDLYIYWFDVDGVAVVDPKNNRPRVNMSTVRSLLEVPGAASEFFAERTVPHGTVSTVWYHSASLDTRRRMHVYTPPGYETGTARYPVLYLLHGGGDDDRSWLMAGNANFILDNLIASRAAKPMIVVMPAGHTPRPGGMLGPPGAVDPFLTDFEKDVVPYVERTYRLLPGRTNRAIAGLSMGGNHTLALSMRNLDRFSQFGVFSSGFLGQGGPDSVAAKYSAVLADKGTPAKVKLMWVATGKEDFLLQQTKGTLAILDRAGVKYTYKETEGGHTWPNWRAYLSEFAPLLFR
jgi:enterochelin esterase-like enzyme